MCIRTSPFLGAAAGTVPSGTAECMVVGGCEMTACEEHQNNLI